MTQARLLSAALLCAFLAACGGGGSDGDGGGAAAGSSSSSVAGEAQPASSEGMQALRQVIRGRVRLEAASAGAPVAVCLDIDGDAACSAGEPQAQADAQGDFALQVRRGFQLANSTLLAQVRAGSPGGDYQLRSRVRPGTVIDVLTTLEASSPLGLSPAIDVHDAGNAEAQRINRIAEPAFLELASRLASQSPPPTAGETASRAANALAPVLRRYVEPTAGSLARTVTSRTLLGEAMHDVLPQGCALPSVVPMAIRTQDGVPVDSKEVYVPATMQLGAAAPLALQIRGRGNTTWTMMPKKPYRLKLDKKAALLGATAYKDWSLLANYSDKTMMRNHLAGCLSSMLDMDYTPAQRYVELTLNGDYAGLYQLADQIEARSGRVEIGAQSSAADDPGMGFLLEQEQRPSDEVSFVSQGAQAYIVQSDASAEQIPNISRFIDGMEGALFGTGFKDPAAGYLPWLDVDSLVDFYLINELYRNNDAFLSSTYAYRPRDGKLHYGPVWDFDIGAGNINYNGNEATEGWWVRTRSAYVARLLQDEQFRWHLQARWRYLSSRMPELLAHAKASAQALDEAQARNFQRWPILGVPVWPNAVWPATYAEEVQYLVNWLDSRARWMDGAMSQP